MPKQLSVAPSARRLTNSLRDIGYSFESAVADLLDNSITAGATSIKIKITFAGRDSSVMIIDNGRGMNKNQANEAMRFGSRKDYDAGDLGRYGLGLKTASLSQCRRLEMVTKTAETSTFLGRTLDLDFIQATDDWVTLDSSEEDYARDLYELLETDTGTVVQWKKLDRLLPEKSPEGGWAKRRIESLATRLNNHLAMIFHRFLSGELDRKIFITVNGKQVEAWDPFCRDEPNTSQLEENKYEVEQDGISDKVTLRRYLLPSREDFSSREAFEAASGLEKWNKQQGIYIYRADRLVQWGGWSGIRTIDEHTKLARASIDFNTSLDSVFNINVAKMRVVLPSQLRKMLERPINELCIEAGAIYRRNNLKPAVANERTKPTANFGNTEGGLDIGMAIKAAAVRTGNYDALKQITQLIKAESPELAKHLGF